MMVYLAARRFSLVERRLNEEFARILERCYMPLEVILPQAGPGAAPDSTEFIHRVARDAINDSDAVVAILEGAYTDSQTCIEMGYAIGKGKLVIGVRTDFRASEDQVLPGTCTVLIVRNRVAMNLDDLAEEIADVLARHERPNAPGYVAFPHVECLDREIA